MKRVTLKGREVVRRFEGIDCTAEIAVDADGWIHATLRGPGPDVHSVRFRPDEMKSAESWARHQVRSRRRGR